MKKIARLASVWAPARRTSRKKPAEVLQLSPHLQAATLMHDNTKLNTAGKLFYMFDNILTIIGEEWEKSVLVLFFCFLHFSGSLCLRNVTHTHNCSNHIPWHHKVTNQRPHPQPGVRVQLFFLFLFLCLRPQRKFNKTSVSGRLYTEGQLMKKKSFYLFEWQSMQIWEIRHL